MHVRFKGKHQSLDANLYADSSQGVVLCPPHPMYGGGKEDTRIVRIAKDLASQHIAALCIDYGEYGRGISEVQNVLDALAFMRERVDDLGLLGYSFGAVVASNVAIQTHVDCFVAVSILRKVDDLSTNLTFSCPKLFIHGRRDMVAPYSDFLSLYREAEENKEKFVLDTDHFYMDEYPATIDLVSKRIQKFVKKSFLEVVLR